MVFQVLFLIIQLESEMVAMNNSFDGGYDGRIRVSSEMPLDVKMIFELFDDRCLKDLVKHKWLLCFLSPLIHELPFGPV